VLRGFLRYVPVIWTMLWLDVSVPRRVLRGFLHQAVLGRFNYWSQSFSTPKGVERISTTPPTPPDERPLDCFSTPKGVERISTRVAEQRAGR